MSRRDILLILILALTVKTFWAYKGSREYDGAYTPQSDSWQYMIASENIRYFHVLSFDYDHQPSYFRPPGYPFLIAILRSSIPLLFAFQVILGSLTVVATYLLSLRFGKGVALISGIGMALGPLGGSLTGQ